MHSMIYLSHQRYPAPRLSSTVSICHLPVPVRDKGFVSAQSENLQPPPTQTLTSVPIWPFLSAGQRAEYWPETGVGEIAVSPVSTFSSYINNYTHGRYSFDSGRCLLIWLRSILDDSCNLNISSTQYINSPSPQKPLSQLATL